MNELLNHSIATLASNKVLWKCFLVIFIVGFTFHALLCLTLGISIKWVNPLFMSLSHIGIRLNKVDIKIRSINLRLALFSSSKIKIVLEGVTVVVKKNKKQDIAHEVNDTNSEQAANEDEDEFDESKYNPDIPLCVFPKSPLFKILFKIYLLYFRFIGVNIFDLTITWEDRDISLNTDSLLTKVTMKDVDGKYNFNLNVRLLQESFNDIELFDTLSVDLSGFVDMGSGNLSTIKLGTEARSMRLGWLPLLKILAAQKKHQSVPSIEKKDDILIDEEQFLKKLQAKLRVARYFVGLVEELNFSLQKFSLVKIPLANQNIVHCEHYQPLVFFELHVKSFVWNLSRLHFDSPGYGLNYDFQDKPYQVIYNFTGLSLLMKNNHEDTLKQVISIPVMNFTGSSNYAYKTLEATRTGKTTDSKIIFIGHLSEPVIDFSNDDITTAVLSYLQYLEQQKILRERNMIPQDEHKTRTTFDRLDFFRRHSNILPIITWKLGVENPVIMLKSRYQEEFYRMLVLQSSLMSLEVKTSKITSCDDSPEYHSSQKLSVHNLKAKYRNNSTSIDENVLLIEDLTLKQQLQVIPEVLIEAYLNFQKLDFDASNLRVLHGLNQMFDELQSKISHLINSFKSEVKIFRAKLPAEEKIKETVKEKVIDLSDEENITLVQLAEELLPPWLNSIRFSFNQSRFVLGSRSLLLSKELVKALPSQTKNDLVNGQLRKVELNFEAFNLLARLKPSVDESESSSGSSLEDDDKGLSDSQASYGSFHSTRWSVTAHMHRVLGKVVSEKSSKRDVLKEKVFFKASNTNFSILPEENRDTIMVKWDVQKVDMLYSVMTHFLIISSIHLLRNTLFEFTLRMKPKPEHPPKDDTRTRSQILRKRISSMIEAHHNVEFYDLILVLPDGLKLRLELSKLAVAGKVGAPLTLAAYYTRLCAESPTAPGNWTRVITANNGSTKVNIPTILSKGPGDWLELENDICNLNIPNSFVIYKIFENISVMFKTLKQLHHSLKYNTNKFVIDPHISPAAKVPPVNIKSKRFIFGMEDDPFEAELNMIFQIGLLEQKARIRKTRLFEQKVVEEFETNHKVKNRSTTFDAEKDKDHHLKLLDDFSSFIPISKKGGLFQKKHRVNGSNVNVNPSAASATLPIESDKYNSAASAEMGKIKDSSKTIQKKISILREGFSKSWITRIKNYKEKMRLELNSNFEFLRGNIDASKFPADFNRKVLEYSMNPLLMNLIFEGLDLDIGPPKFGIENVADFNSDVGKGVPKDTQYSILIPFHIDLKLKELRCHLRDYPLPLIHMPAISKNEPQDVPGVRVHGHYVIAEAAIESKKEVREVFVALVPGCKQFDEDDIYSLEIPKTLTAIKSYVQLDWELNSCLNTTVTWGTSYQPSIQQIMLNLDNFTKPPIDPSPKVGFWDKFRFLFHARMRFKWNYNGALQIQLKGSKNPYSICAENSGFTLGFENDVVLNINEKDDPREFLVVDSKTITFGIQNHIAKPLTVWCRDTSKSVLLDDPSSNFHGSTFGYYIDNNERIDPIKAQTLRQSSVEKSVITLSGGVQFKLAIAFERKLGATDRTSSFKSHTGVLLTNPKYVKDRTLFDSYENFRSHFIHLGISLFSTQKGAYNKIQLSPLAFQYFFEWWRMFSNTLSVRHGPLFGPVQESTKFSRHLYTLKYQAILEPLFISDFHIDPESVNKKYESIESVGVKGKASKFVLDLHQRKELTFDHNPNLGRTQRNLTTKFNIGKVDITELDLRAVKGEFDIDRELEGQKPNEERYTFESFDGDLSWLDITDFVEIGAPLLKAYQGKITAYPLMNTPKFRYFKHNSYGDEYQRDFETNKRIKPFGNEEFHDCEISEGGVLADTQLAQMQLRLDELDIKLANNSAEIKKYGDSTEKFQKDRVNQFKLDNEQIRHGMKFVSELMEAYKNGTSNGINADSNFDYVISDVNEGSKFTNRFTVHNMLLKWNDTNRDIVHKFIFLTESSKTQKKFLQHRALSQLDELIDNQRLANLGSGLSRPLTRVETYETGNKSNACEAVDTGSGNVGRFQNFKQELHEVLVNFFYKTHDTYFIKLISPQIQLQTEADDSSCLLVAAPSIELNIIEFDSNETEEDYNENIFEQRFGAILTSACIFTFNKDEVLDTGKLFFRSTSYGSQEAWPPWLGVELCYDGSLIASHILMEKTSLVFRYDRAISSSFIPSEEANINKLVCDMSQAVITCDSQQYYTLYNIVTHLLIYNEPRQAAHKERESKMLFSLDMNDLSGMKTRILELQEAVREADYILQNIASRRAILDDLQRDDMKILGSARNEAIEELHILMHVSLSGNTNASEDSSDFQEWFIRADDIKLHLLDENRNPFVDVVLFNSHFKRVERSDRSDKNIISIQNLEVINLDKSSSFPVIFSSHHHENKHKNKEHIIRDEDPQKLIQIFWNMDHPVGGIRVMKRFEVELLPLQISLEESTGEKLLEFMFPNETPTEALDSLSDNESNYSTKTEGGKSPKGKNGILSRKPTFNGNDSFKKINGFSSPRPSTDVSRRNGLYHDKSVTDEDHSLDAVMMRKTDSVIDYDDDSEENEIGVDEMVKRASNYLSFITFKLRSGSISITFRGHRSRRLINVTDFVLTLPEISFTNKTYTLLDVTMVIKKAVIKALLSHTGSILGNKFFRYGDGKSQKAIEGVSQYSNDRIKSVRE